MQHFAMDDRGGGPTERIVHHLTDRQTPHYPSAVPDISGRISE